MGGAKRSALWLAAGVVLTAACGSSPSTSRSAPAAAVGFSCSLPVVTWSKNGGSLGSQNGSISVPSGVFTVDPAGSGGSYDWPLRRWVPVSIEQVLPDGSAYAYEQQAADSSYEIHVVQVASGFDKMVYRMPYDNGYQILAFVPEGIYVYPIAHRSGLVGGLWFLDANAPPALKPFPTSMNGTWQLISGGAAWGGPAGTASDRLVRFDLATGAETTWFQHTVKGSVFEGMGFGVSVIGFDGSGRPLVEVFPPFDLQASPAPAPHPEVWLVSAPGVATKLNGPPLTDEARVLSMGVTDSHGVWFVGSDGFYLYTDAGFRRAAPWPPGPVGNFAVAGACV